MTDRYNNKNKISKETYFFFFIAVFFFVVFFVFFAGIAISPPFCIVIVHIVFVIKKVLFFVNMRARTTSQIDWWHARLTSLASAVTLYVVRFNSQH